MKKHLIKILLIVISFMIVGFLGTPASLATSNTTTNESTWVSDAFDAAKSFLQDSDATDDLGIVNPLLIKFRNIVNALNTILLVLLAGISAIALAVVGVKYIMAASSPEKKGEAKESLHTVFWGMAYGFGAYLIWKIAMGIVSIIINAFA
jgi:hypothetical protein